jgi:hypothetical protein
MKPFFENYPPKESEHSGIYSMPKSTSVLRLAVESCEPEVVWMILNNGIATSRDIGNAWTWVSAGNWKTTMKKAREKVDDEKLNEIRQLVMTFGGFTPPPTPNVGLEERDREASVNTTPVLQNNSVVPTQAPQPQQDRKQKPPSSHDRQPTSNFPPQRSGASSPQSKASANGKGRGRGRGRGK